MNELTNPLQNIIKKVSQNTPKETGITQGYEKRFSGSTSGKVVILADVSGSMGEIVGAKKQKIEHLKEALSTIVNDFNNVTIVEFSCSPKKIYEISKISAPSGSTALHLAINMAISEKPHTTIIISDGEPDNESAALEKAKSLTGVIHVVYCGPENGSGLAFLNKIARDNGGRVMSCDSMRENFSQQITGAIRLLTVGKRGV